MPDLQWRGDVQLMQILDKNWPWQLAAAALFIGAQAAIWFMIKGFDEDFGMGFAIGLAAGIFIALAGAGWRRGEMQREEILPPPSQRH